VYCIYCIRYFRVLVYVISVIIMVCRISYTEICYLVNRSWHSLLCCINRTADSKLTQLLLFIHQAYVFIHQTTITIQKKRLCVTQFQFFYVPVSIHDSFSMRYRDTTKRSTTQDASMHPNMYLSCRKCL
jgi:hypothetical protein